MTNTHQHQYKLHQHAAPVLRPAQTIGDGTQQRPQTCHQDEKDALFSQQQLSAEVETTNDTNPDVQKWLTRFSARQHRAAKQMKQAAAAAAQQVLQTSTHFQVQEAQHQQQKLPTLKDAVQLRAWMKV